MGHQEDLLVLFANFYAPLGIHGNAAAAETARVFINPIFA
jgi:hypothetical protein